MYTMSTERVFLLKRMKLEGNKEKPAATVPMTIVMKIQKKRQSIRCGRTLVQVISYKVDLYTRSNEYCV